MLMIFDNSIEKVKLIFYRFNTPKVEYFQPYLNISKTGKKKRFLIRKCPPSEKYVIVYALSICLGLLLQQCGEAGSRSAGGPAEVLARSPGCFDRGLHPCIVWSHFSSSSWQYPLRFLRGSDQGSLLANQAVILRSLNQVLVLLAAWTDANWRKLKSASP